MFPETDPVLHPFQGRSLFYEGQHFDFMPTPAEMKSQLILGIMQELDRGHAPYLLQHGVLARAKDSSTVELKSLNKSERELVEQGSRSAPKEYQDHLMEQIHSTGLPWRTNYQHALSHWNMMDKDREILTKAYFEAAPRNNTVLEKGFDKIRKTVEKVQDMQPNSHYVSKADLENPYKQDILGLRKQDFQNNKRRNQLRRQMELKHNKHKQLLDKMKHQEDDQGDIQMIDVNAYGLEKDDSDVEQDVE